MIEHDIVQVNIYRRLAEGNVEYLLLKRTVADGGFWQPVTGHIETGETHAEALQRELQEETGISELLAKSDVLHTYEYELRGGAGRDTVYAVEVDAQTLITLNPEEHVEFEWLSYERAIERLKYDGNKDSLKIVQEHLAQS